MEKITSKYQVYEGHSETIDTPPPIPFRTKTKDLLINLRSNDFEMFPVRIESFSGLSEPRKEERKQVNFWKEPQPSPYTTINFPSSQNCHSPACFFLILGRGENSRWINDQVKIGEEIVESR